MVSLLPTIRRFLRALETTWSIVGLTLIAIMLTEAGFRLVFAIKDHFASAPSPDPRVVEAGYGGESWVARHYRELEALEDRWEPYVYFRQKPFAGATIAIDEAGRRRTWQAPPTPNHRDRTKEFRIMMLGGSSLWGFGARDDRTIPSLIARELHERGFRVEVRNLAEIGYVSTQEVVALLRELQSGYRPDLVIFYDGVNDTTSALLEGEAGVTTNERNRRLEFNIRQSPVRLGGAMVARLIVESAAYRFAQAVGRQLAKVRGTAGASTPTGARGDLAAEVVRRYRANIEIVDELARGFGFDVLYFWQPVVFGKASPTEYERHEAEKLAWAEEFFADVYEAVRGSRELRDHRGFHDLSREFSRSDELVFIDFCHTTEAGYARIAGTMLGPIASVLRARTASSAPAAP